MIADTKKVKTEREKQKMKKQTALKLLSTQTVEEILITLDAEKVDPSWKIGEYVRIDIDDTGTIPKSLHGNFKILDALNFEITNLDHPD